jgi:hypothetical protein
MPLLQRRFSCAVALLALSLSAACQDKSPAITAVNREIGVSFAPSLIAYREFDPTELDSEHGWAKGGGFKAAAPFDFDKSASERKQRAVKPRRLHTLLRHTAS